MADVRCHTFQRGDYTLWADRVPAVHGRQNMFTLWRRDVDGDRRLIGGVSSRGLRRYLKETSGD